MDAAPSGIAPRICAGIPAHAHATSAPPPPPPKTASGLQRVFKTYRNMPPIEHNCSVQQRLALQPPQPGIAVAQHRRQRVRLYARHHERLLERTGCDHWAVARESEAGLVSVSVDYLTGMT